jgi:DNA helicase IV
VLTPQAVAAARTRARRSRKPHNQARVVFVTEMLDHLARELAQKLGRATGLDVADDERADLVMSLRDARDVRVAINLAWLPITPERLLADLYADPRRLAAAAPNLTTAERALLYRDRTAPWTVSDIPLLDEAAELLGEDDESARSEARRRAQEREAELRYAQQVLDTTGVAELMPAEVLVDRYADAGPVLTTAERAAGDRTWAYGHIIVDEAQELSSMMWRLLMRRCPTRSMTLVGDVAQTGSVAGAASWADVLEPYVGDRWAEEQLTVNYRTPARIMDLAVNVAKAGGIDVVVPASVREGDAPPRVERIDSVPAIGDLVRAERLELPEGRLAVVTPRAEREAVFAAVRAAVADEVSGPEGDAAISVLTARECKGLEFDGVVVVEPAAIVAESPRGINDLYVALTRPTQRLLVAHTSELPPGF